MPNALTVKISIASSLYALQIGSPAKIISRIVPASALKRTKLHVFHVARYI